MRVAVLDHPSNYPFPPHGYGAQEKWFWTVAYGAHLSGAHVTLVGPDWRTDLPFSFPRLPFRLEDASPQQLRSFSNQRFDLVVAGHEYTSHPRWRQRIDEMDVDVVSYQHRPDFVPTANAYDGTRRRLYVFTAQMHSLFASSTPGYANGACMADSEVEAPRPRTPNGSLVWASKFHASKAPHVVAKAAIIMKRPIQMYGPIWDAELLHRHADIFNSEYVHILPEVGGREKLELINSASCALYSSAPGYIEAGSAFFSDPLRCGVPVAAQVWDEGTAAASACDQETGVVAVLDRDNHDDEDAAAYLAESAENALALDRGAVRKAGALRFSPVEQFQQLLALPK